MGALKGMLRDQLLAERGGASGPYSERAILAMFSNFLYSALQTGEPVETFEIQSRETPMMVQPREAPVDILDQHWIHRYLELAALALDRPEVRETTLKLDA
jgi:hypothetical protein